MKEFFLKENSLEQISFSSHGEEGCSGAAQPQKPENHCPRKPVCCTAL